MANIIKICSGVKKKEFLVIRLKHTCNFEEEGPS